MMKSFMLFTPSCSMTGFFSAPPQGLKDMMFRKESDPRMRSAMSKQNPNRKLAGALADVVVGNLGNYAGDVVPETFSIRLCLYCQSLCNFFQQIKQASTFCQNL
jgi:hypothetical protein